MVDTFKGYRPDGTSEHRKILAPDIHAVTTLNHHSRMVQDGFFYSTVGKVSAFGIGAVSEFLFVVPAGAELHFLPTKWAFGAGDIDIDFFEGVTTSNDGTLLTNTYNVNRNSTATAEGQLRSGAVFTDYGINPYSIWIPPTATGIGQTHDGTTSGGSSTEWIIKQDSKNAMRVTNNSGEVIDFSYQINWYEVHYHD